jgi:hypothetical protein
MLVRFSSTKTESITMFGDIAVRLIRMFGGSGNVPGAIGAEDIPSALQRLQTQWQISQAQDAESVEEDDKDDGERPEPPVALATRAFPLIDILTRAGAAKVPVMWEKV